jgi:hypothetical protein
MHLDGITITRDEVLASGSITPHHTAQRGCAILDSEVDVARRWTGEIGYLAFDPHILENLVRFE